MLPRGKQLPPATVNLIDEIAKRTRPDAPAVIADGVMLDFATLFARADDSAEWLRARLAPRHPAGVVPRVGLACPNGVDYIIAALGILKAGACLVPVPDELAPAEVAALADRTALHGIVSIDASGMHWQPLDRGNGGFSEQSFAALEPAFIRFSSGTTGDSKGVVLGHQRLRERITAANEGLAIGPSDRVLWMLPMAHHFAVSIMLYLYHGACTVLAPSHLAADVLETAEATGATVIYGAPFHYSLLAADASDFRWPSLRLAVSTAAALSEETAARFSARFAQPLVQGLGIIECGLPILNTTEAAVHPTALGRPMPAYRVELRDESGAPVTPGRVGELWIQGPGFFDAYLSPWQTSDLVCADGWFATGDLAETDASGLLFLRGRSKSMLNINGMKVFPEEIEAVLDTHPGVHRSRATGREHPVLGTIPVAEITPADPHNPPTLAELTRWCRQSLATFKVPVKFEIVPTIDLTPSGKVRRC
jgi:long-chain acyl-CoA synthetase